MPTLRIPAPLRPYAGGQSEFSVPAETVGEALNELVNLYPALKQHLFSEDGELRAFVNLFLNEEDIRHLQGVNTPVSERDRLILIPSIAGG